jgi:uncharacterized protein YsxB (DUF464 family)
MIRCYVTDDTLDNEGVASLVITGHASPLVCAGASALWNVFTDGLARLAKEHPKQMTYQATVKKKQSTRR